MTSPTTDRRQGLVGNTPIKVPVACATTGNITLYGEQVIDGVQTSASRVLVMNQSDTTTNGIYDSSSAAWTRTADADGNYDLTSGTLVLITGGSQGGLLLQLTTPNPITIGTSHLVFGPTASVGGPIDPLAPTFLKTTSDLLSLNEVSLFRFIDRSKWAGIGAGTNVDDLSSNINTALNANGTGKGINLFVPRGLYNAQNCVIASDNTSLRGVRGTQIKALTAGHHILEGVGRTGVTVDSIGFVGQGSGTLPVSGVGGYQQNSTGLVALAACNDVRLSNLEATAFYNGLSTVACNRVWMDKNYVSHWYLFGALLSLCTDFHVMYNDFIGSDFAGAGNSYGVSATGNTIGGQVQTRCDISFNNFKDIPAWDAVMCHEVNNLRVIGNDAENVRAGLDLTASLISNVFTDIIIALNTIRATTTDTWAGAAAQHGGILCQGFDSSHPMQGLQLLGNIIDGFFNSVGMVGTGNSANISLTNTQDAALTGNQVRSAGSARSNAGILVVGSCDGLSINGGTLRGAMSSGAVRFAGATGGVVNIGGVSITQATATDPAVNITGSTLSAVSIDPNPTNSSNPLSISTSTVSWANTGTFSASIVGCTSSVTGNVEYSINGQLVTLTFPAIQGTSNATGLSFTGLPAFLQPVSANCVVPMNAVDNGAFAASVTAAISIGSGTIVLSKAGSAAGWTSGGTKGCSTSTLTYSL